MEIKNRKLKVFYSEIGYCEVIVLIDRICEKKFARMYKTKRTKFGNKQEMKQKYAEDN